MRIQYTFLPLPSFSLIALTLNPCHAASESHGQTGSAAHSSVQVPASAAKEPHGQTQAQAQTQAQPQPKDVQAPTPLPQSVQLAGHQRALPSPALSHLLQITEVDTGGATLQLLTLDSRMIRKERFAGQITGLAWLTDRHYLLLRRQGLVAVLEARDALSEERQVLDYLPPPESAPGLISGGFAVSSSGRIHNADGIWVAKAPSPAVEDGYRVVLAARRAPGRFEVRDYLIASTQSGLAVLGRVYREVGADAPKGQVLRQLVPNPDTGTLLAVWEGTRPDAPALSLELQEQTPLPLRLPLVRKSLAQTSEDLSECAFAKDDQVICQTRVGNEQGWLFVASMNDGVRRLRQLTPAGSAAAFAVSPEGGRVAYVGSGGPDGAVVVMDLHTMEKRQVSLVPKAPECGSAVVLPQVSFVSSAKGERLLSRGYCTPPFYVHSTPSAEPVVEAEPAKAPAAPRKARGKGTAAFWRPRY